eukprot:gene17390-18447_t
MPADQQDAESHTGLTDDAGEEGRAGAPDSAPAAAAADPPIVVKADRGFGFAAAAGEYDLFLHASNFKEPDIDPKVGDGIQYDMTQDKQGRPRAANIMIVAEGMDVPEGKGRLPKQRKGNKDAAQAPKKGNAASLGAAREQGGGSSTVGTVTKWWDHLGAGIVTGADGKTAYVPPASVKGEAVSIGAKLRYLTWVGRNGRLQASKVTILPSGGRPAGGRPKLTPPPPVPEESPRAKKDTKKSKKRAGKMEKYAAFAGAMAASAYKAAQ